MREIRRDMRLLKYGVQAKAMGFSAGLFIVLGIVFLFADVGLECMGTIYVMLGGMFLGQLLITLPLAEVVAASPRRRHLSEKTWHFIITAGVVIGYVITIFAYWWRFGQLEDAAYENVLAIELVGSSLISACIILYMVFAYKCMVLSSVVLGFVCSILMPPFMQDGIVQTSVCISLRLATLIGSGLILLAVACAYVLQRLLYRLPLDKMGAGAALKKYL